MSGEKPVIVGIDTSNYRTSICIIDEHGEIVNEERQLLSVEQGERGLQQSAAVFQHISQLPEQVEAMMKKDCKVIAVSVSSAPRPVAGSYMPVFRVGEMVARTIAACLHVPLYHTTHQEGHIAAGEYSMATRPKSDRFLAVHLSGGTSEILLCQRRNTGYNIEKIGGTNDLHAGQLVDRIGVALGLPFPAGPALEHLAKQSQEASFSVPSSVDQLHFHLSGSESALLRAIEKHQASPSAIARATEKVIANTLEKTLRYAVEQGFPQEIVIVGGVAANQYIKQRLKKRLEHRAVGCRLFFTEPVFSGDNAYGVAMLGLLQLKNEH